MTTNLIHSDISSDTLSVELDASERTLRFVLAALSEGRFSEAVNRFDDHFTFIDHALGLEFTDKERLIEFFRKSRELFPDTALEIESTFSYVDHAVAECDGDCDGARDEAYAAAARIRATQRAEV